MTQPISCADYLNTLSKPQLRCWVRLNLSYDQIANVWLAINGEPMNEQMQGQHLSRCIIELVGFYDRSELNNELAKQCGNDYKLLPDSTELEQIAIGLIDIAKKQNLTTLDLSFLSLTYLPNSLFELTGLETLYLTDNLLTSLPDNFANLSNLSNLNLDSNKLTSLPQDFSKLSNLKILYLSRNQLTSLPQDFGNLSNLKILYLSSNQLTSLPDTFGSLSNLSTLNLDSNQLTSLPDTFGSLSNLSTLYLDNNQLTSLPDNFGSLSKLSTLSLYSNQLTSLPDTFGSLSNLSTLYLSNNLLTSLPDNFGNLSNLSELYLYSNQLTSLPDNFGSLSNLSELSLSSNQLTSLPQSFSKLTNLIRLNLQGNDSLAIPPEILQLQFEPSKILNYYFELLSKQEKKQLNEAKMLIVGQGAVGKTSLVNRLVNNVFNESEKMTYGISINKWPIQINNERNIQLNIWDFGGQEIMHATHQFFLTKRSLYLLVIDARQGEQDSKIDYWLKTIINFASDAPIIIVINKIDVQSLELDRRGLKLKYPNIKAFIETSCKDDLGIDSLKQAITKQLSELKHLDDQLVKSWFKVKEELENTKQDYLEYSQYEKMCRKENINQLSEETLIGFLHDLGVVLCFYNDLRLRDTHILNPQWVTEGVYKILNYRGLAIDKGELHTNCLNEVFNDPRYPRNKHRFIIEMMSKFELCFELEGSNGNKLLIPDLLPKELPELGNWDDSLRFEYHYDLLPSSIISRFIVRMNAFIYNKTYWRYGVVLESEDKQNKALIKADLEAKKILIFVNGRADIRRELLSNVRADLLKIHKTIPKLQFEQKIPLPEDPTIVLDYEYLLELIDLGEDFVVPKGHKKKIPIRPLLEGIERKPNTNEKEYQETKSPSVKPLVVNLSGSELEILHKALLNAFDMDTLEQMLLFKLNKDLASITTATSFTNIVFSLTSTANKQGWMAQFIIAAKHYVPGNESLNNVIDKLLENR